MVPGKRPFPASSAAAGALPRLVSRRPVEATRIGLLSPLTEKYAVLGNAFVEAALLAWEPISQTVVNQLTAQYALVLTNTGNVNTTYLVSTVVGGGSSQAALQRITIPAQHGAVLLVDVAVPSGGSNARWR